MQLCPAVFDIVADQAHYLKILVEACTAPRKRGTWAYCSIGAGAGALDKAAELITTL